MNFVGERRGDYVQELNYTWVGEGNGEFDLSPHGQSQRRVSYSGCLCCLASLTLFTVVVFLNVYSGDTTLGEEAGGLRGHINTGSRGSGGGGAGALASPAEQAPAAPSFHCDPRAMVPGDAVQAAFDISFRPTGMVTEGSLGEVAALLPTADHRVVVNWKDHDQLLGAKVDRDQLVKVVKEGDAVEAFSDIVVKQPRIPAGALSADDLVLAARDINGRIPKGTYGYVSSVKTEGATKLYALDFPEFPQFANTQVSRDSLVKAPRVADKVRSVMETDAGAGNTVPEGTSGVVVSMKKSGTTYTYTVQWEGLGLAQPSEVNGIDLIIASDSHQPAPVRIPKGARGQIVSTKADGGLADALLVAAWPGITQGPVNVTRGQVVKVPNWSKKHRDYCCKTKQVECVADVPTAPEAADPFTCDLSPQDWSDAERQWCCAHRELGGDDVACPAKAAADVFNCTTKEQWPQAKVTWCCNHKQLGCTGADAASATAAAV